MSGIRVADAGEAADEVIAIAHHRRRRGFSPTTVLASFCYWALLKDTLSQKLPCLAYGVQSTAITVIPVTIIPAEAVVSSRAWNVSLSLHSYHCMHSDVFLRERIENACGSKYNHPLPEILTGYPFLKPRLKALAYIKQARLAHSDHATRRSINARPDTVTPIAKWHKCNIRVWPESLPQLAK
ncbi:MAG: hypothetical protein QOJ61_3806 [Mycobacterium sp.]|jgi:hypothetical protein|nr:hypothetical protein [Mycobacterium sp.]